MEELTKAMEILDKISFFGGQRAGRELWNDKTREVQDEDIASFNRDIEWLREFIRKHMNDGWIPVDKQLPEAGEHVLASFKSDGFLPATAIISENGRWSMLQGAKGFNDVTEDVIAWRPLPEPYRPKKESEGSRRLREREEFFRG